MTHQLYDTRLSAYFGQQRRMTPAAACAANRDLYLAGKSAVGWKRVEQQEPAAGRSPARPPAGLVEALVGLGFGTREAKRLASQVEGGTIEDGIRKVLQHAAA